MLDVLDGVSRIQGKQDRNGKWEQPVENV